MTFLGYRIGRNYCMNGQNANSGTLPTSTDSIRAICLEICSLTEQKYGGLPAQTVVAHLDRIIAGRANYVRPGQPARPCRRSLYDRRLSHRFFRKHGVRSGEYVRFPSQQVCEQNGQRRPSLSTKDLSAGEGGISTEGPVVERSVSDLTSRSEESGP